MNRLLNSLAALILGGLGVVNTTAQSTSNAVESATLLPQDSATAARLNETLIELRAKSALLLSLAEEHLERSQQAAGANQPDKARWEQELATELNGKNSLVANQLTELKLERTKFEEGHGALATARSGGSAKAEGLAPDEVIYLTKLNERAQGLEQEIGAAMSEAQAYALQLQTNNTPEQVQSVSLSLEDNRRTLKELHKQQSELELKKLEFWAYRRQR